MGAALTFSPIRIGEWVQQDDMNWPQVSEGDAMLQIPSFTKIDVLESHGGSMFHRRRTRETERETGPSEAERNGTQ